MFKNLFNIKTIQQNTLSWKDKDVTIILDAGHGKDCLGKCSPKWPHATILRCVRNNKNGLHII